MIQFDEHIFQMGGLIMYQLVKHLHGSPEDEALSNEESCWRCAAQNIIISYQ